MTAFISFQIIGRDMTFCMKTVQNKPIKTAILCERLCVLAAQCNGLVGKFTRQLGLAAAVAVAAHVGVKSHMMSILM